jgi:hypothetical protein
MSVRVIKGLGYVMRLICDGANEEKKGGGGRAGRPQLIEDQGGRRLKPLTIFLTPELGNRISKANCPTPISSAVVRTRFARR